MCRYKTGKLSDTPLDALVMKILEKVREKSRLDPQLVEDICLGNVGYVLSSVRGSPSKITIGARWTGCAIRQGSCSCGRLPEHYSCFQSESILLLGFSCDAEHRE